MTDPLAQLIATEESNLRILEAEVEVRRQRIRALKTMFQSSPEWDAVLAKASEKVNSKAVPSTLPLPTSRSWQMPEGQQKQPTLPPLPSPEERSAQASSSKENGERAMRKKGEVKSALLLTLTEEAQPLVHVQKAMNDKGYELTYDRVRTQLWSYKNEGLVTNPKPGYYGLTPKGMNHVSGLKGEVVADSRPPTTSGATKSGEDD